MIEVRQLTADEWKLWGEVRLAALADAPEAFTATLAEWVDADEARWRARLTTVPFNAMAFEHGRPIGQVSCLTPDAEGTVILISLWVDPQARGRGAARALVEAVTAHARHIEATSVYLRAFPTNTDAITMYERFGFAAAASDLDGLVGFRYRFG
jgi:ribosomal protein S18 acetylase RimI-like enzyme